MTKELCETCGLPITEYQFHVSCTLLEIDKYVDVCYEKNVSVNKIFYKPHEWTGWRFYLKALRHGDFRSIKGHILSHF